MIVFFIAAAALLLGALGLVLYPLLRTQDAALEAPQQDAVVLARERLAELKLRHQHGELDEAEYQSALRDLETQVADDLHDEPAPALQRPPSGPWAGIAVLVGVPLLSGVLYLGIGTPAALSPSAVERGAAPHAGADGAPMDVEGMVRDLAARLEQNPDDAQGWFMLARSYMALRRFAPAAEAYARLRGLVGDEPDVLLREATARAMANGGELAGEPRRLVRQALEREPDHPQALWMAATAAFQANDTDTALDYYRRAEPLLEGEAQQQVRDMISQLGGASSVADGAADAMAPGAAARAPGDGTPAAETPIAALDVTVSLDPALRARATGGDTVFIFARAVNGPPMPLAVVRRTVADLPLTVTLDDTQAMMPRLRLSQFDQVTISARVSGSGEVTARPGDLEGDSGPVAPGSGAPVAVTIDRVVQAKSS